MLKTIQITDRQYDWFAARARKGKTMLQAIEQVITLVDRLEADLAKYKKWAGTSVIHKEVGHETLPLE